MVVVKCTSDKGASSKSEEISSAFWIGESIAVPTKTDDNKPKKTVDLNDISNLEDLKSIQEQDSFMYYSIPGVRKAKVLMEDIDMTNLIGAPARAPQVSQKVSRKSRISFECHPDLLFENFLNNMGGLDFEDEDDLLDMDL